MSIGAAKVTVRAWKADGILLEQYTYTVGSAEPLPKHSHHEYQLGLSWDRQGQYYYRGVAQQIPCGNLSIIQSGEVHVPNQRTYIEAPATCWVMLAEPELLQTTASELAEKSTPLPFFPEIVLSDVKLAQLFLHLHRTTEHSFSQLEQDSSLLWVLTRLIECYARNQPAVSPLRSAQTAVLRVRDFLRDNYAGNISLKELAGIAELSSSYLCRAFCQQMGVSPHVYQTQIRIDRAKRLLLEGMAIAQVASAIGFYDQSHFGWHFKRLVGVTPSSYQRENKNFLDTHP